jgi:hypothetical protein
MPIGRVDKVCFSRTNKPQIMMGGTYYRIESHHGLSEGMYIDYDAHSWDYPKGSGKIFWGIDKWGPANVAVSPTTSVPVQAATLVPPPHVAAPSPFSDVPPGICGIIKSLIEAGKEPDQLQRWVWAFQHLGDRKETRTAERSAQTKQSNADAQRIIQAINSGQEQTAFSVYEEVCRGDEASQSACFSALPTTVRNRMQDLMDQKFIDKPVLDDAIPNF